MKPLFNAYVDGFSLYKGSLETRPHLKWLDLPKFCASRRPDFELGDLYFFTSPVKKRYPGDLANERQNTYLRVLRDQGVKIIPGQFRKDLGWMRLASHQRSEVLVPRLPSLFGLMQHSLNRVAGLAKPDLPQAQVWKYGEKGSDVNLASYLLRDAFLFNSKAALVVTADSDFATPFQMLIDAKVDLKVVAPKVNAEMKFDHLRRVSSFFEEIHVSWLESCQLPPVFIKRDGGNIVKPSSWT